MSFEASTRVHVAFPEHGEHDDQMQVPCPDDVQLLHAIGQDALLELELATIGMDADEKWAVEQLLLAFVADSVPAEVWGTGIAAGVRAVRRQRNRSTPTSPYPDR